MPVVANNPVPVILGTASYYRVLLVEIATPQIGTGTDGITVTYGAFVNASDTVPLQIYRTGIGGDDLVALMSSVPSSNLSLYAAIKSAIYGFLQSKNLIPAGALN